MKDGKYFVKPWKLMKSEFGLDSEGDIKSPIIWNREMEDICPEDRIIEIINCREWWIGNSPYIIDKSILIGPAFKYGDEIEVSNDGENWIKEIFISIVPGKEMPYYTKNGTCKYARPVENKKEPFDFSVFNEHKSHVKRVLSWHKREIIAEIKEMMKNGSW